MTNNHVIEGADKIEVRINNKEKYAAKLVGKDPATDLALLKIDVKQRLTPLPLGDSDRSASASGSWPSAIRSTSTRPSRSASSPPRTARA